MKSSCTLFGGRMYCDECVWNKDCDIQKDEEDEN